MSLSPYFRRKFLKQLAGAGAGVAWLLTAARANGAAEEEAAREVAHTLTGEVKPRESGWVYADDVGAIDLIAVANGPDGRLARIESCGGVNVITGKALVMGYLDGKLAFGGGGEQYGDEFAVEGVRFLGDGEAKPERHVRYNVRTAALEYHGVTHGET